MRILTTRTVHSLRAAVLAVLVGVAVAAGAAGGAGAAGTDHLADAGSPINTPWQPPNL